MESKEREFRDGGTRQVRDRFIMPKERNPRRSKERN